MLQANVRAVDVVGRYGGEEFMLVLPETDADAAATMAEKLRRVVAGRQIRIEDGNGPDDHDERRRRRRPRAAHAASRA